MGDVFDMILVGFWFVWGTLHGLGVLKANQDGIYMLVCFTICYILTRS